MRRNPGDEGLRRKHRLTRTSPRDPAAAASYAVELERRGLWMKAAAAYRRGGLFLEASLCIWQHDLQRTKWYVKERGASSLTDLPENEVPVEMPAYQESWDVFYYSPSQKVFAATKKRYGIMGHGHSLMQIAPGVPQLEAHSQCELQLSRDGMIREFVPTAEWEVAWAFPLDASRDPLLPMFTERWYRSEHGGSAWFWNDMPDAFMKDFVFLLDTHWLLGWPMLPGETRHGGEDAVDMAFRHVLSSNGHTTMCGGDAELLPTTTNYDEVDCQNCRDIMGLDMND